MATLADYDSIRTAIFVKIDVDYYWTSASGWVFQELAFSDHAHEYTFGGTTYTALGDLMSITGFNAELAPSGSPLTITLNGIPDVSIEAITKSKLKSSPVLVYRGFFDTDNQLIAGLPFANPLQRYSGYLNNYSLNEDWDPVSKTSTNTMTLDIGSNIDVVQRKVAGRRTNPRSMARYYPSDESFSRVPALQNQKINFGR